MVHRVAGASTDGIPDDPRPTGQADALSRISSEKSQFTMLTRLAAGWRTRFWFRA